MNDRIQDTKVIFPTKDYRRWIRHLTQRAGKLRKRESEQLVRWTRDMAESRRLARTAAVKAMSAA